MNTLTHAASTVKPTLPVPAVDDDAYGPETDAWRYELGPEPTDADRVWWASQDIEGGMVEGESDRSDLNAFTVSALDYRLDRMAEAVEAQDRLESGLASW